VRRLRPSGNGDLPSQRNPDVNLDIGQAVQVDRWDGNGRARTAYRGAMWDVELLPGEPAVPGRYLIREIDGSCLRLSADIPPPPAVRAAKSASNAVADAPEAHPSRPAQ
jgi:hypothetical protein